VTGERSDGVAALRRWVADTLGGEVTSWRRLAEGNSRSLWFAGTGSDEAVLRVDAEDGPLSGTELTLHREAAVYRALGGTGVLAPRLLAVDVERQAMLLTRVPGSAAWTDQVLDGLLRELGRLHSVDARRLDLPGFDRCARGDLDLWARIAAARIDPPSPLVDLAFTVLREHFPGEPERLVLCHGDAGPGNVMHENGTVTALLDWEFAHFGDPVDDLAWVTARAVLYGLDLPGFAERVREHYEPAAGLTVEDGRLAYWQAVALLRNLVSCHAAVANPVRGRDRLVHLMLIPALERLVIDALARLEGVELAPTPTPEGPADLPGGDVLREVAAGFDTILRALTDAEARSRAKRMRILLGQLARTWTLAPGIARADAAAEPACDRAGRLQQLADAAERRLALFPRSAVMARAELASMPREAVR
jgi:aminoglycoside phosphotransferase (APT) family kinase protein